MSLDKPIDTACDDLSALSFAGSVANPEALQTLHDQACRELEALEPELTQVEQALEALQQRFTHLKQQRQRLLTLKLSLQPMLALDTLPVSALSPAMATGNPTTSKSEGLSVHASGAETESLKPAQKPQAALRKGQLPATDPFSADVAFHEINQRLRQRDSVNYEIFRAIVYAGGQASTEQIKAYLIEQDIRQPANGESFVDVSLADISARANYLVKKGLVTIESRGVLRSVFGWLN